MFSGGQSSENVSLLPDNPGVRIEAVQGGGSMSSSSEWVSEPIKITSENEFNLTLNTGTLKKYQARWRQTLGPSIPSRRKPRQDPHIIIGSLNINECPTYIVAPLRGEEETASMVFAWADELLHSSPESHIVFMEPLMNKISNKFIENSLISLLTKYPGHVIYVCEKETGLPSLDGLLLSAVPETSKQIAIGFIPDHENVYHRSTRNLDCLEVDTLRIPFSSVNEAEESESLYRLSFSDPTRVDAREKEFEKQIISRSVSFKTIPGWVTKLSFGREYSNEQYGGVGSDPAQVEPDPKASIEPEIKPGKVFDAAKSDKPLDSSEIEVQIGTSPAVRIRKNATDAWQKGDFTAGEKAILESQGLKYSNPIYSKFFEGLVNNHCNSEPETILSSECGVFRYIMADKYYREIKAIKDGKQGISISSESNSSENTMPGGPGPNKPSPAD